MARNRHLFLNSPFGHEDRWPAQCPTAPAMDGARFRRWVTLEDGDQVTARWEEQSHALRFACPGDLRTVRRLLKESPAPFLHKLELVNPDGRMAQGDLVMVRTAMPVELPGVLTLVTGGARPEVRVTEDQMALHVSGKDHVIVATAHPLAPGPLCRVWIRMNKGPELVCELRDSPCGYYLEVVDSLDRAPHNLLRLWRIVRLEERLVVSDGPPSEGCEHLHLLFPGQHRHLAAWLEYERQYIEREAEFLLRRLKAPLEYTEFGRVDIGEGVRFNLSLASSLPIREWVDLRGRGGGGKVSVDAQVEIADHHGVERKRARLLSFVDAPGGQSFAEVEMYRPEERPANSGKIIAVEKRELIVQGRRRANAVQHLGSGEAAAPNLLDYLLDPASVPPVRVRMNQHEESRKTHLPLAADQREAVRRAVSLPPLFVIQGPPGTGKTHVIAAIIEELRHRARNRQEPAKVLVSSIQNQAVDSLEGRCLRGGMQVFKIESQRRRKEGQIRTPADGRSMSAELRTRLRANVAFAQYELLQSLEGRLGELLELTGNGESGPVIAAVAALQGQPELLEVLTPRLRDEFLRLSGAARPSIDTTEAGSSRDCVNAGREFLAALFSLASPGLELSENGALRILETLDAIDARYQQAIGIPEEARTLADDWLSFGGHLKARRGGTAEKLRERWQELAGRTRAFAAGSPPSPAESDPVVEFIRIASWLAEAAASVHADLEDRRGTEAAILHEWVSALEEQPQIVQTIRKNHAPVTAATCEMAAEAEKDEYDLVIVDEAARAGLDVLIPIVRGRSILMVGDHHQLPPYVEEALIRRLDQGILDQVDLEKESLFKFLWDTLPEANKITLTKQYRMHEDIGRMVSRVFYEPKVTLSHHFSGERASERAPRAGVLGNTPLVWVDTGPVERLRGASRYRNEVEAEIIKRLLERADRSVLSGHGERGDGAPVGVITFYEDQKNLLKGVLERYRVGRVDGICEIETVDGAQGREWPLVFLSCVRSDPKGRVGFLGKLYQRINVAVSRAQRQLVIVGDASTLARADGGSPWLGEIHAGLRDGSLAGRVIPVSEVSGD